MSEVAPTWHSIDLPVLTAIVIAEQSGEDVQIAARREAKGISDETFNRHIQLLHSDGYIEAAIRTHVKGGIESVTIHRALPKAYRAAGAWPNSDSMIQDLLLALQQAEEAEPDSIERGKIRAAMSAIVSFTSATVANVVAPLLSKQLGL
jgi:hypothetical protein